MALDSTLGDGAMTMELKQFIQIASESFALPQFQRPPTWDWTHQRDLLESIFQKVPIGSIMIWEKNDEKIPDLQVRLLDEKNQNMADIKHLILDGQQRMRFLTLLWLSIKDDTYCHQLKRKSGHIYFYPDGHPDSKEEKIYFVMEEKRTQKYDSVQGWVSLQHLLSSLQTKNRLKTYFVNDPSDSNEFTQKLDQMYENFNNYTISYHNLGPDIDYATALLVYERVNLAGKRLSALDVAEAVYISKYPDLYNKIKEKTAKYAKEGFGSDKSFSRKRILNNISVELYRSIAARPKQLSVFKPKRRDGKELKENDVKSAFNSTIKAFDYLLGILQTEFSMSNDKPIITNYPIIVAAAFLRKNKSKLTPEQKGKMTRWLALAILENRYAGKGTNTKMDEDLDIVYTSSDPWKKLYENMGRGKKMFEIDDFGVKMPIELEGFVETRNSWMGQLYIAKMNWEGALDFISLQSISSIEKLEWHHIFPQSLWNQENSPLKKNKNMKNFSRSYINHFANKAYISKQSNSQISGTEPLTYLTTIDTHRREVLEAHDLANTKFFQQEEYKKFLDRRLRSINKSMNKFLDELEKGGSKPKKPQTLHPKDVFSSKNKESQTIEWKETYCFATKGQDLGKRNVKLEDNLMKEICGMANSGGGYIFLGVDDDGNPTGMDRDYSVVSSKGRVDYEFIEGHIGRKISSSICIISKPSFKLRKLIKISSFDIKGKEIVAISVPHWPAEDVAFKFKASKKGPIADAIRYTRNGAHKDPDESGRFKLSSDKLWIKVA